MISLGKLCENIITFYGGKIQKNPIFHSISIENSYFICVRLSQKQAPVCPSENMLPRPSLAKGITCKNISDFNHFVLLGSGPLN